MLRTLALRRESLTELTDSQLESVAGGAVTYECPDYTYYCLTGTGMCHTQLICT